MMRIRNPSFIRQIIEILIYCLLKFIFLLIVFMKLIEKVFIVNAKA